MTESTSRARVGRYHLVERLAVGGMAEVFLAVERGGAMALDRLVVIKRILPHLAEQPTFVDMFLHEARIAARINHPNIVEIHELGQAGGFPFIVMEYVAGSTLKELLAAAHDARTRLPLGTVVHLLSQACAGAHAAHELRDADGQPYGLVHRDLSPHNLMVSENGHIKLLDFGIAKASEGMDNTRTGMLKGKISYMSPEQCRQEKLDRRSDIFALGIVGWELCVGVKPFKGKGELATMQAIVTGRVPSLRQQRPDVPEPVADVVHRALALDRADRYDTAADMRTELRDAARGCGIDLDPDRPALLVRTLLGVTHEARRKQVDRALERTLVSMSALAHTDPGLAPDPTTESTTAARVVRAASWISAVGGLLALLALSSSVVLALFLAGWAGWLGPPVELLGDPIEVAVAPTLGSEVLIAEHEPIRRYLESQLHRPLHMVVATSYGAAADRLVQGEVDYAFLPHRTLRTTLAAHPDLVILATKVVDGSSTTDGYLLVRRDVSVTDVSTLKGVLCFTDADSSTGYALPRHYLRDKGMDPDADFETRFSGNHDQILHDLIAGRCDLGGTFSGSYQTADQRGIPTAQLRIFDITGHTYHDAMVARPAADPDLTRALREALLAYDPRVHSNVERAGESERITGFTRPPDGYLDEELH